MFSQNFKYVVNDYQQLPTTRVSSSQQDLFVVAMTQGLRGGTFLELGAAHPVIGSNTYNLEQYLGWRGTSIDLIEYSAKYNNFGVEQHFPTLWKKKRPDSNYCVSDAFTFDYSTVPRVVDYLQVDLDPARANLDIIHRLIPDHVFKVITFEHDAFDNNNDVKEESRSFLLSHGYQLVVNDVSLEPGWGWFNGRLITEDDQVVAHYEDWYVHPAHVAADIIQAYQWIDFDPTVVKVSDKILFNN